MDIFNSRELAVASWLLITIVIISSLSKKTDMKPAFKDILSALFARKILSTIGLMTAYITIVIYYLLELNLWNIENLIPYSTRMRKHCGFSLTTESN